MTDDNGEAGITAVIFDLDGTLIDSVPDVVSAMNRLLVEEGRPEITQNEGRNMVGDGARALVERAYATTGAVPDAEEIDELTRRYVDIYHRFPVEETTIYRGVPEVLSQLRAAGVQMGICTNKPHVIANLVLTELDLASYFCAVIGGDKLPVRKPDAGHIHAVLDAMGCAHDGAIYVGDSPVDMAAARNARLPVIAVSYGYSKVPAAELGANALIDHFTQLPDVLARFRGSGIYL